MLHYAAPAEERITLMLIEKGEDINAVDYEGKTPLHLVYETMRKDTVSMLLELGANPNILDKNGKLPANYKN